MICHSAGQPITGELLSLSVQAVVMIDLDLAHRILRPIGQTNPAATSSSYRDHHRSMFRQLETILYDEGFSRAVSRSEIMSGMSVEFDSLRLYRMSVH